MKLPVRLKVGATWIPVKYTQHLAPPVDWIVYGKYLDGTITLATSPHPEAGALFSSLFHELGHAALADLCLDQSLEELVIETLEEKLGPLLALRQSDKIKYKNIKIKGA